MTSVAEKTAPRPKGKHWLLGNFKEMISDPLSYLTRIQKEEGNLIYLSSPMADTYVVYDADGIKHILQDNNKNYRKGDLIKKLKPLFGDGLVTNEGDFWKKQRRLMQPAFNKERYGEIIAVITQCVADLLEQWENKYKDGDEINISMEMNKLALRVVAKALFKTDIEENIPVINQNLAFVLSQMFKRFSNPVAYAEWLPIPGNLQEKRNIKELDKIIYGIIKAKKERGTKNGDILDMLMEVMDVETNERMTDKQIRDEVMTIIVAGHETTANAMSFMWYALVEHPEIISKVDDEAGKVASEDGVLRPENMRNAAYIRQVVQETLRLYPPPSVLQRETIEEDVVCGYHIPKKKNVMIPTFVVHRMKEYWGEDAEDFNPDRFVPEKMGQMPKYAYLPFGGGQRLCIGDQFATFEMMIALLKISQKYRFERVSPEPVLELAMAMRPKEDIILRIFNR